MEIYRHTQLGGLIIGGMIVALAIILVATLSSGAARYETALVAVPFLLVAGWLFGKLSVVVSERSVRASFGPGLIRRTVALSEIESAQPVTNSWLWGWGIRRIPGGWMYNVSGLRAVELKVRKRSLFRIGTDEPERLIEAIQQAIRMTGVPGTASGESDIKRLDIKR